MEPKVPAVPRWELRAFGERFPQIEASLAGEHAAAKTSTDIYVVAARADINVKIRAGQLDVKRRLRVDGALELWSPILKATFPIDAAVAADVLRHWRIVAPVLSREHYDTDQFLDDVIARCPGLRVVRVGKTRRQASIAGAVVELATLDIEGQVVQTAAIESEHPDEVLRLARALSLEGRDNESYVAALQRLLHVAPDTSARGPLEGAIP